MQEQSVSYIIFDDRNLLNYCNNFEKKSGESAPKTYQGWGEGWALTQQINPATYFMCLYKAKNM